MELKENDLLFAKVNKNAKIPSKLDEDAGMDVYACFDEDYLIIKPHETVFIPTGIASAMTSKYEIRLRDRGTNAKYGLHVLAGTIDSGFRNQWYVALNNVNSIPIILSNLSEEDLSKKYRSIFSSIKNKIIFRTNKAIAQAEVCEVPVMNVSETSYDNLKKIDSKRGMGMLGSSGK